MKEKLENLKKKIEYFKNSELSYKIFDVLDKEFINFLLVARCTVLLTILNEVFIFSDEFDLDLLNESIYLTNNSQFLTEEKSDMYNVIMQMKNDTINNKVNENKDDMFFKLYEKDEYIDFLNAKNNDSIKTFENPIFYGDENEEIGIVYRELNQDGLYSTMVYFEKEIYVNYDLTSILNDNNEIESYKLELEPNYAPSYSSDFKNDIFDPITNEKIGYVHENFYNSFSRGNSIVCYLTNEDGKELVYKEDFSLNPIYDKQNRVSGFNIHMLSKDLTNKGKTL